MKRFFAILLAAMILLAMLLTGCSEKGEVAVEEITATEAVTEEATTVATEETTAYATETTVEETTAETAAQIKGGTYAADKDSIVGTWYAIDSEGVGDVCWTFSEDGTFTASDGSEQETGTYTIDNGLMELTLSYDGEPYIQSYTAVIDGDVLLMTMIGLNTELIREEFVPYEAGQSINDYFWDNAGVFPTYMSKEKSVLAEQKDVLGEWIVKMDGETAGTCIFEEKSMTLFGDYETETLPVILKNGEMIAVDEISENTKLVEDFFYLCGGKIYIFDDSFPMILERADIAEKDSFPTGYWMNYIERPDYTDRKSYTFNDDGTYRISMEMHDIYDNYTFSDNVLTMTFDLSEQGWGTYRFSFDVTEDNGNYILKYKSEEIDGNMPDVQTVTQTSDQELIVQLENLFEDYRNEEMLCFEKY